MWTDKWEGVVGGCGWVWCGWENLYRGFSVTDPGSALERHLGPHNTQEVARAASQSESLLTVHHTILNILHGNMSYHSNFVEWIYIYIEKTVFIVFVIFWWELFRSVYNKSCIKCCILLCLQAVSDWSDRWFHPDGKHLSQVTEETSQGSLDCRRRRSNPQFLETQSLYKYLC